MFTRPGISEGLPLKRGFRVVDRGLEAAIGDAFYAMHVPGVPADLGVFGNGDAGCTRNIHNYWEM